MVMFMLNQKSLHVQGTSCHYATAVQEELVLQGGRETFMLCIRVTFVLSSQHVKEL